jgi:hypothetical protein
MIAEVCRARQQLGPLALGKQTLVAPKEVER